MSFPFADSVAILTGASRGIGPIIAERLAAAGLRLALVARDPEGLRQTAGRIAATGRAPLVIQADIGDEADQIRIADTVRTRLGPPALLVNNAAIERIGRFQDLTTAQIKDVLLTNLLGAQILTRLVLPGMLAEGRGHIVNIGSVAGRIPYPYGTVNSAAKQGLTGFTWSLWAELRGTGVGVSVVHPTLVGRVGIAARWPSAGRPPLLRQVSAERVAQAVVDCVRKDRVEVTVAPATERIADVVSAVSPRLAAWGARRIGLYRYLRDIALATDAASPTGGYPR
ncbi:SDR family NAD(P)-dependent oxidoreductase [Dactylosporangium roseum]|uniref:SDR family NAD(P)-dependent oxidoreductase n=1 Tax=Dactylosporangium roseum TaxID=47989 RepID=A0ABY5Z0Y5_9ACTN|nr:SDR family NAD(P)-dependent oxidoreductase [Dactylosporangium roseum]UWZ34710.1 SDR family NAD(P)-dependent oxidoreductase [Dactylosporangium roseum]